MQAYSAPERGGDRRECDAILLFQDYRALPKADIFALSLTVFSAVSVPTVSNDR